MGQMKQNVMTQVQNYLDHNGIAHKDANGEVWVNASAVANMLANNEGERNRIVKKLSHKARRLMKHSAKVSEVAAMTDQELTRFIDRRLRRTVPSLLDKLAELCPQK